MSGFKLTDEQAAIVSNRGGELLVSAAAGSGKTRVLVERLLGRMLIEGRDVTEFLVITFTNAAAAELRSRITAEISERAAANPADKRIQAQLTRTHLAHIMTIHGFCSMIIRSYAAELEISPDFHVMDENESAILKQSTLSDLLEKRYANAVNDKCFTEMVDTLSPGRDDSRLKAFALSTYEKVQSHADPEGWMQAQLESQQSILKTGLKDSIWGAEIMAEAKAQCGYWLEKYEELIELANGSEMLRAKYLPTLEQEVDMLVRFYEVCDNSWDEVREASGITFGRLSAVRSEQDEESKKYIQNVRDSIKKAVRKLPDMFTSTEAELVGDIEITLPALKGLFSLVGDFTKQYLEQKSRFRALDYNDLEHLALKVVSGKAGHEIAMTYTEIMVDEFQDTNEIQDKLISCVSKNRENVFMVGDVKQSIYKFRLADPTIFLGKYSSFTDYKEARENGARKIVLSMNFRSQPEVIEAVNHVFNAIMSPRLGDLSYDKDQMLYPREGAVPSTKDRTELKLIDMGGRSSSDDDESPRAAEVEARYVASRISELLREGMTADEHTGELRRVKPGDIAILLRSPKGKAEYFTRALKDAGIPCSYGGSDASFLSTLEVSTALALLNVIDNPNQDVALIAALRSPVFGFTGDELARIRAVDRSCSFYEALRLCAENDVKCKSFIETLDILRQTAADFSADKLIWRLYSQTNLLAIFAAQEDGRRRRENLLLLYHYAKSFESSGHKGLFGFLSHVRRIIEQGGELRAGAPESADAVRIMSIHSSKGMEFPIVILAGLAGKFNMQDTTERVLIHPELGVGMKVHELERRIEYPTVIRSACALRMKRETLSEEMRVLYVAMTRAKEKLIMTAAIENVSSRVQRLQQDAREKPHPQALMSQSSLIDWLILAALSRHESGALRQFATRQIPGRTFEYIWNIDVIEKEDVKRVLKKTRTEDTEAAPANVELDRLVAANLEYTYPHTTSATIPAKLTATYLKGREIDTEAAEQGEYIKPAQKVRAFNRPNFAKIGLTAAERGTALHLVMQFIDYARCTGESGVDEELRRLSELQIITEQQAKSVDPGKIVRFFETDIGREILSAAEILREFKFSILAPASRYFDVADDDELLLQGVIDCAIVRPEGVVIIDFKTDEVKPGQEEARAENYRAQLGVYSYVLERILKKPVIGRIIYFFATSRALEVTTNV